MQSLDLLFARVEDIDKTQHQIQVKQELGARTMEQLIKDQAMLARRMEATEKAVAHMRMDQFVADHTDASSGEFEGPQQHRRDGRQHQPPPRREIPHTNRTTHGHHHDPDEVHEWKRYSAPKLVFPSFEGVDPTIWRDKCEDYFRIMKIPEYMWVTIAFIHMNGNAAKWARVLRCKGELGNWTQFMNAVEAKFGSYDYKHALESLLELSQEGSMEDYVTEFENLQFQIEMHNTGYDKLFFITQFTRGLKPEIGAAVQSQVPKTMERAVMLAKVQQHLWEKGRLKFSKYPSTQRASSSQTSKYESKQNGPTSTWSKERQKRDFCKANNLCFYCSEPFDATHLAKCTKRPRAQVKALALNDLDVQLTEEVVKQLELEDALAAEFCTLSLNAVTGTDTGDSMKLRALVQNKVMLILVDSGSSHSFVSSAFLS